MIPFTRREIEKAWRENLSASSSKTPRTNPHRLLLFYAVECGLKAILMRRRQRDCTDASIAEFGHDINRLLDTLGVKGSLRLPAHIRLKDIKIQGSPQQRNLTPDQINQLWRYGHSFEKNAQIQDKDLESMLFQIAEWIKGELRNT
ncbi:hypothetical protein [Coleofasciculus chthonoplastes]|uniref:hypothetical protein n=1 Tax=Coleofasciculus chthonoplastes TaxID=64178 RepID=UPI004063DF32